MDVVFVQQSENWNTLQTPKVLKKTVWAETLLGGIWNWQREQKGKTLLDFQNTTGSKQVDKTIQLQTHTNYVLQVLNFGLWVRWEQLFRMFKSVSIFQEVQFHGFPCTSRREYTWRNNQVDCCDW